MDNISVYSFEVVLSRTKRGVIVHEKFYFLGTLSDKIGDVIRDEFPWVDKETIDDAVKTIISRQPYELKYNLPYGTLSITTKELYDVSPDEFEDDYYCGCITGYVNDMFTESLTHTKLYAPNLKEFKRKFKDDLVISAHCARLDADKVAENLSKFDINSIELSPENSNYDNALKKLYVDDLIVVEGILMKRKLFRAYDD